MGYQVLARKWRPEIFEDLVGQEHVLQALTHGLDQQRLHHAYLFTGTRGVGKTTIGRILARCLNCETGVTARPCGQCSACQEIGEGRFVDLIEIDAASRTKVEDMRELLDNVQYAPTRGRFKIYLIDEVHMLSNSSFNALLKTLEEPPEHVKFLFATTDPQKLPVTILSRCLQFNLKQLSPERIVDHLQKVLAAEAVDADEPALWALARAADGSMRDALSLTDQAVSFSGGHLQVDKVSRMLGTIDRADVFKLLQPLIDGNGQGLLQEIERIAEFAPDYGQVLAELLSVFHRVALEQAVPGSVSNAMGDAESIVSLARRLSPEDTQLFYQAALLARKDLEVTPDARMGFEMALLRMLAFRPGTGEGQVKSDDRSSSSAESPEPAAAEESTPPAPPAEDAYADSVAVDEEPAPEIPPETEEREPGKPDPVSPAPEPEPPVSQTAPATPPSDQASTQPDWVRRFDELALQGMVRNLASNAEARWDSDRLVLTLEEDHYRMLNDRHRERIRDALSSTWRVSDVVFDQGQPRHTPATHQAEVAAARQQQAVDAIHQDQVVQRIVREFNGRVLEDSIRPL